MALLPIIVAPDPRLKLTCEPVTEVTDELRQLMDDMLDTMYDAPGIGLAAPQVGVTKRIIVVDVTKNEDEHHPYQMVNPEIKWRSEELLDYEEGCLSLPEQYAQVTRPEKVRVRYLDRDGNSQEVEASDILATCIQHEMDHLDGVLFVDHLSKLRRDLILRKLKKYKAQLPPVKVGAHG
jgi:peptide deformylase|tara:strand:- start:2688 stop:3224 length:537 start_codon:yes stop_codon:yes gene_type:complete